MKKIFLILMFFSLMGCTHLLTTGGINEDEYKKTFQASVNQVTMDEALSRFGAPETSLSTDEAIYLRFKEIKRRIFINTSWNEVIEFTLIFDTKTKLLKNYTYQKYTP